MDDLRVRAVGKGSKITIHKISEKDKPNPVASSHCFFKVYKQSIIFIEIYQGLGRVNTPVYRLTDLGAGTTLDGPTIVIDHTNTIVIENDCFAKVTPSGDLEIQIGKQPSKSVG